MYNRISFLKNNNYNNNININEYEKNLKFYNNNNINEYERNLKFYQRLKNRNNSIQNETENNEYFNENASNEEDINENNSNEEDMNKNSSNKDINENNSNEEDINKNSSNDENENSSNVENENNSNDENENNSNDENDTGFIDDLFFSNFNYENEQNNNEEINEEENINEEINIKIKKNFLIEIILFLYLKLQISKAAFISLISVFNFIFKLNFNYKYFEKKINKKINLENNIKKINEDGTYIYNNIKTQIFNLLNYENNFEIILKNIKKIKENKNESELNDITDGKIYKKPFKKINPQYDKNGILLEEINLNMILNIDGVSPYNTSNQNYYVVCGQIIELPLEIRLNFINQILIFLIKSKYFNINEIFKFSNFIGDLNKLYNLGFKYKNKIIRLRILCYSMDLPARALLFNQNQFNGFFSCIFCKTKGEFVKGAGVRFPNSQLDDQGVQKLINCEERKIEDFRNNLGFKPSTDIMWYNKLIYFEPNQIAIDCLHQCFEGLFKYIIKILLDQNSIFDVEKLNTSISEIKPPGLILNFFIFLILKKHLKF
jgi:hypothetical protein